MLDQVRFGNEISYLRKKRGLTQNMLANKLCTQALISKIEQGQVLPGIDILYELSIRLKVPLTSLIKKLIYERQDYYDLLFYDLDLLLYNKSYDEIITICKPELNRKMLPKIRQNFCRFYTLAQYYLKKLTAEETIEKLSEMIDSNIFYHHYMEDVLHNDIANIYVDQGSYLLPNLNLKRYLPSKRNVLNLMSLSQRFIMIRRMRFIGKTSTRIH
ncbi:helix-turn-helix protein [compost metagenome]